MAETRRLYCCACETEVDARLISGAEAYVRRPDLANMPFWCCDGCGNFVGCHHRHHDPSKRRDPLGCIPTPAIKSARQHIHRILDPLWQSGRMKRRHVYGLLAEAMGKSEYHTAEIRSVEEARDVYRAARRIADQPHPSPGKA